MQNKQRDITFFTPTMKRTGSEIVLFNLISRISQKFSILVISVYKGELLSAIHKKHTTFFFHQILPTTILSKIIFKIKETFLVPFILMYNKNKTWYINTIVLWNYLEYAEKHGVKVILHVHELEQIFELLTEEQLHRTIHYPHVIIANSNYTKQLVQKYGREKPIELCYPAIDTKKINSVSEIKKVYRQKLNISEKSFVWVMCGTLDENKNPNLFIDIAFELCKTELNIQFLWIGGTDNTSYFNEIKQKTAQKNLSDKIRWIEDAGDEYMNYFNCADGFILTSKKESFSIVTLEALLLGLPVVTHDCGGVKEILREDVGLIIKEKNNISQFLEAMHLYMNNTTLHNKLKGIERAKEFDIEIWSEKWNLLLDNYID